MAAHLRRRRQGPARQILDKIHRAGRTLVGYNSRRLRLARPAGDPRRAGPASRSRKLSSATTGRGLPAGTAGIANTWPTIKADHVDLAARTRWTRSSLPVAQEGRRQLGVRHLQELPYRARSGTDRRRMGGGQAVQSEGPGSDRDRPRSLRPRTAAIAALSQRYSMDLRSSHQAGIASKILCAAYKAQHGADP